MELGLHVEGVNEKMRHLMGMAERVTDFTDAWPLVKEVVQRHTDKWLSSSGEGTFAPLAPSTLKKGGRRSTRPLDKSGEMWDSLVGDTSYTHFVYDASKCEIGTSASWAHWHMYKRKHMPARPPIKLTDILKQDVRRVLLGYVRGVQMGYE